MLYNIVLVSAIYQHESATGILILPPSLTSLPLSTPSHPPGRHRTLDLSSLCHSENFHWLSNFVYSNIYVSMLLSQFVPPSLSHPMSTNPFSVSVSPLLLFRWVYQYRLSRFHIYSLIYDICLSLSDLLHSV